MWVVCVMCVSKNKHLEKNDVIIRLDYVLKFFFFFWLTILDWTIEMIVMNLMSPIIVVGNWEHESSIHVDQTHSQGTSTLAKRRDTQPQQYPKGNG